MKCKQKPGHICGKLLLKAITRKTSWKPGRRKAAHLKRWRLNRIAKLRSIFSSKWFVKDLWLFSEDVLLKAGNVQPHEATSTHA